MLSRTKLHSLLAGCVFLFSLLTPTYVHVDPVYAVEDPHTHASYEYHRARLLAFMLSQELQGRHFSHKRMDDEFSRAAFRLYLRQLDSQKRFLLADDVERLRAHSETIDNELAAGSMDLPDLASSILSKRVSQLRPMVAALLSGGFDFKRDETIETDPEKIDYCRTEEELKERWRKTLKFQVLNQYLSLRDDDGVTGKAADTDLSSGAAIDDDVMKKAVEKVSKTYETLFNRLTPEATRDSLDGFFEAVVKAFDPHTEYMPPSNKEDFEISMRGSLEGIGATLKEEDGFVKVVTVLPGGPAYRQGSLHAEDIILKVAEGDGEMVDITDMKLSDAVRLIRGKKGSVVRLSVRKPDGRLTIISITRDVVQLEDAFAKGEVIRDKRNGKAFGYIKLPSFYRDFEGTRNGGDGRNATDDVRKILKRLESEGIDGLVLDLRNNGGGALTDAIGIAGLFIRTGPVVQVKDVRGAVTVLSDTDPELAYGGPLVILVNRFSASASEILAGAMQDYGRAVIVGSDHTYGKGTVQSILDLDSHIPFDNMEKYRDLGVLKLTIQKFYRISGESTQYKGVTPDVILPDRFAGLKSGERYLDYALPWDTVERTAFSKWQACAADDVVISSDSSRRVSANIDFTKLKAELQKAEERRKKTVYSLNIDTARRERAAMKTTDPDVIDNFHGGKKPGTRAAKEPETAEEKRKQWIEGVQKDIYVTEAMAVLGDVIKSPACVTVR